MKVIFLDVDGVLNNWDTTVFTAKGFQFVEDEKVALLKSIINATDAKVVLSSDWRYDRNSSDDSDFVELRDKLSLFNISFFDFTPEITWDDRGKEIQSWLDSHPDVTDFVIIDDRDDMQPNMDHLVQTVLKDGLTEELAAKAIKMLNGEVI